MRAIRSEQFAQRLKWHILVGDGAMVLRHGFAEGGESAETGDEKCWVDAHEVASHAIPATLIRHDSKKSNANPFARWDHFERDKEARWRGGRAMKLIAWQI